MPIARTRSVLSGMRVKEAMRRQMIALAGSMPVSTGIGRLIKAKADALLVMDAEDRPAGVVSKTDMVGAYYAGLPVDTPLEAIMVGPLQTCFIDDDLEQALDVMRSHTIHQLFVVGADAGRFEGMLHYGDILGLVFQICRRCRKSQMRRSNAADGRWPDAAVADVMTPQVMACSVDDTLTIVIESLTAHRMNALLVTDTGGHPAGVISKTNLVLAWHHGIGPDARAAVVMSEPVVSCGRGEPISQAMTAMLLGDMGRIFVHDGDPRSIVGVLSLSDAANNRSGTCRACVSSRMIG